MNSAPDIVWDLPTRLFHWSLVVLVALQYASAEFHWLDMQWHLYGGYALLTLILFRVLWGLFGSASARFSSFVRGPAALRRFMHDWRGRQLRPQRTHNPIGGWSVVLMLSLLSLLAVSGLASSDDIDWFGPLTAKLDSATIAWATRWHHRIGDVLPWLIALHLGGVVAHEWRGERVTASMWHGRRDLGGNEPARASLWRAGALALLSAGMVYALLRYAGS